MLAWRFRLFDNYLYFYSLNDEGDPFQVDPLPKTFYYPSQQKELPEDQRKVLNSFNIRAALQKC